MMAFFSVENKLSHLKQGKILICQSKGYFSSSFTFLIACWGIFDGKMTIFFTLDQWFSIYGRLEEFRPV